MPQKDYILRVAEDVGRALAQIIYHQEIRDYQGALSLINEVCKQSVGMGSDFIHAISEETLLAAVTGIRTSQKVGNFVQAIRGQYEGKLHDSADGNLPLLLPLPIGYMLPE